MTNQAVARKAKDFEQYFVFLLVLSCVSMIVTYIQHASEMLQEEEDPPPWPPRQWYAVFTCRAPDGVGRLDYDCAFLLPLAVLAWDRLGFQSVVQIVSSRSTWARDPVLSWSLEHVEAFDATVRFIAAERQAKSTPFRVTNVAALPGNVDDYFISAHADVWPLNGDLYTPKFEAKLVLVDSSCCEDSVNHIGATKTVWREILNERGPLSEGSHDADDLADDARTAPWLHAEERLVDRWIQAHGNSSVFQVSGIEWNHLDGTNRAEWAARILQSYEKTWQMDQLWGARLPEKPFHASNWEMIKQLLVLMFGDYSWQVDWADEYAAEFGRRLSRVF